MSAEQMPPLPNPPTLPKPFMELHKEISPYVYAAWADQMHAYARLYAAQEVEKEREAIISICEEWGAWNDTAQQIAEAIRARGAA